MTTNLAFPEAFCKQLTAELTDAGGTAFVSTHRSR